MAAATFAAGTPPVSTHTAVPPIPSITPVKDTAIAPAPKTYAPPATPTIKAVGSPVDHAAVRAVVGQIPPAYQQGGAIAASEVNPVIANLMAAYTAQGHQGAQAIRQATADYAASLGQEGAQYRSIYGGAEAANAAAGGALADRLSGAGESASDSLAARLASINEPGAVNPVAASLGAAGAGAGGAIAGIGTSATDQLIADSAHAQQYAAGLAPMAKAAGVQEQGSFAGSLNTAEAKALAPLLASVPKLTQSAASTITGSREKAAALEQSGDNADSAAASKAAALKQSALKTKAGLIIATNIGPDGHLTPEGLTQLHALGLTSTGLAGSAGVGVVRAGQTAAHNASTEAIGWARVGIAQTNATTAQGRLALARAKQALAKGHTTGALTESETGNLVSGMTTGKITSLHVPATDKNGKPVFATDGAPIFHTVSAKTYEGKTKAFTYQEQLAYLEGLGKTPEDAQAAVNGIVKPGQLGRPWLTPQVQAVLAHSGGTHVMNINGHAVLAPNQVAALSAAGLLPYGGQYQQNGNPVYIIGQAPAGA